MPGQKDTLAERTETIFTQRPQRCVPAVETHQSHIGSSSSSRSAHRSAARPGLSLHIYHTSSWGLRPSELRRLDWPSGTSHGQKGRPTRRNQRRRWVEVGTPPVIEGFFSKETHGVFIRVHRERQLLESLSDLSDRRLPGHSQQLVVVLALRKDFLGQCEREEQSPDQQTPSGPLTPEGDPGAHQAFRMVPRLAKTDRKHVAAEQSWIKATGLAFILDNRQMTWMDSNLHQSGTQTFNCQS